VFRCKGEYTEDFKHNLVERFPDTDVPHRNTVRQLIKKSTATGSVKDMLRSGRPTVLTEDKIMDVSSRITRRPRKSVRRLSQQVGVSYESRTKAHEAPSPASVRNNVSA
jgi:transposase